MAAVTKGGKTIEVLPVKGHALYKVQFQNGGRLPKELTGNWTSRLDADTAVKNYLARSK